MIEHLSADEACRWYASLAPERRLATLSPDYVIADALRDPALHPCFFGYREGGQFWLHGVHRSAVPGFDFLDQQSPYGYGGPSSNADSREFLARAWQAYVSMCRDEGVLAEFVRFHPMGSSIAAYGGVVREDRQTVVLDVQAADLRASYSGRCRTAIRKAEQGGLTVRLASPECIGRHFPDFYRAGMRAIGADAFFAFNDAYFEYFEKWSGVQLLVCELNGEWLAAGLFLTQGAVMEYHLSASTALGRKHAAANLLLDAAAHEARRRGCTDLYLGGGTDGRADNALLSFKGSFSRGRRPFSIGFTAFSPQRYDALKDAFVREGKSAHRFLFYR